MPGIVALVSAISDDVMSKLAGAGRAPLTDGGIVMGRVKLEETVAAPRVVFVPKGSLFEAKSTPLHSSPRSSQIASAPGSGMRSFTMLSYGSGYSPGTTTVTLSAPDVVGGIQATATATVTSNGAVSNVVITNPGSGYINPPTVTIASSSGGTGAAASASLRVTPQALAVMSQRALLTEWVLFEVHVWDIASPQDPNTDFDECQLLYQQVIASTHLLAPGAYRLNRGDWTDARPGTMQLSLYGHEFVFQLQIMTPVVENPMVPSAGAPVQFAPAGVQPAPNLSIVPFAGGTPESP